MMCRIEHRAGRDAHVVVCDCTIQAVAQESRRVKEERVKERRGAIVGRRGETQSWDGEE